MHNPLSQKGHRQAKALARRIQSEGIESLYASNYRKEGQASGQRQQDRVFETEMLTQLENLNSLSDIKRK